MTYLLLCSNTTSMASMHGHMNEGHSKLR